MKITAIKKEVTLYLGRINGVNEEFFNRVHRLPRSSWAINMTASLQPGKDAICVTSCSENWNTTASVEELNSILEISTLFCADVFCTPNNANSCHGSSSLTNYFVLDTK
jgi:hypothetical protein